MALLLLQDLRLIVIQRRHHRKLSAHNSRRRGFAAARTCLLQPTRRQRPIKIKFRYAAFHHFRELLVEAQQRRRLKKIPTRRSLGFNADVLDTRILGLLNSTERGGCWRRRPGTWSSCCYARALTHTDRPRLRSAKLRPEAH